MANPRTPLGKAKLTGAAAKNPQRFRSRTEPKLSAKPVGKPPAYMTPTAKEVWKETVSDLGWLVREDRIALENMCNAVGQMRDTVAMGEPLTASLMAAVNVSIGKIGASPTDRGKVLQAPEEETHDPFAKFEGAIN